MGLAPWVACQQNSETAPTITIARKFRLGISAGPPPGVELGWLFLVGEPIGVTLAVTCPGGETSNRLDRSSLCHFSQLHSLVTSADRPWPVRCQM